MGLATKLKHPCDLRRKAISTLAPQRITPSLRVVEWAGPRQLYQHCCVQECRCCNNKTNTQFFVRRRLCRRQVLLQAILESAVVNRVMLALFCHNMVHCAHVYVKQNNTISRSYLTWGAAARRWGKHNGQQAECNVCRVTPAQSWAVTSSFRL
jgi:hypothetical protein